MPEPSNNNTTQDDPITDPSLGENGNQTTEPTAPENDKKQEKVTFTPEQQAVVDAIVKDRLTREREKSQKAQEDAKKALELQALEDRKEWETLASERKTLLDTAQARIGELEPLQVTVDRQNTVISALVQGMTSNLPDAVKPLLTKLDPIAQLEYLVENRDLIKSMNLTDIPETPDPDAPKEADLSKAREDFAAVAKSWF